jgi:ribosomal protein S18 acetylase RimI-like enzyme
MRIQIVDATINDLVEIEKVRKAAWLTTYPNEDEGITVEDVLSKFDVKSLGGEEEYLSKRTKELLDENSKCFVAKVDNKVVGFSRVLKDIDFNKLATLYILEDFQRKGIGTKLVEKGIKWLGGGKEIRVKFANYNMGAKSFYESLGFRIVGDKKVSKLRFPTGKEIIKSEMVLTSDML